MLRQRDLLQGVTDEEFSVVRCQTCGLLYLDNSRPGQKEIGRYYPHQYSVLSQSRRTAQAEDEPWTKSEGIFCDDQAVESGEDYYGYPSPTRRGIWCPIRKIFLWPGKACCAFP